MRREDEYIPAVLSAARSKANNCCCNMCFKLDYVTKLCYPTTCYHKIGKGNERVLSQSWHELWLCDECKEKLINILEVTK